MQNLDLTVTDNLDEVNASLVHLGVTGSDRFPSLAKQYDGASALFAWDLPRHLCRTWQVTVDRCSLI